MFFNKGNFNSLEKKIISIHNNVLFMPDYIKVNNYSFYSLNHVKSDDENQSSIVIFASLNNNKILFMGDADKKIEKQIINEYNIQLIDILKVGHHGSKTSSGKTFINTIKPYYSIISAGKDNKFGHPHKQTLAILKGSKVLNTAIDGSIRFVFRKDMVNKFTCKPYTIVER